MRRMVNIGVAVLLVAVVLLPVTWFLLASFKTRADAFTLPPDLIFKPTLENYRIVLLEKGFGKVILNSVLIASCSSALVVLAAAPLSFLISRGKVKHSFLLFFSILTTRMAPSVAIALPLYWIFSNLRMTDTYPAIILTHVVINFAIGIWLLRTVFDSQHFRLEEAGMIDGHSFVGAFFRLVLPVNLPGMLATFFILFILSWNEMLLSFIISGFEKRPLTSSILGLITPQGTFWGQIAAVSTISLIPILVLVSWWRGKITKTSRLNAN